MFDESIPREARRRAQLEDLADALDRSYDVLATDVVDDAVGGRVVIEVTIRPACQGVRPCVQRIIAKHGATIADVTKQGEPAHPIATVI